MTGPQRKALADIVQHILLISTLLGGPGESRTHVRNSVQSTSYYAYLRGRSVKASTSTITLEVNVNTSLVLPGLHVDRPGFSRCRRAVTPRFLESGFHSVSTDTYRKAASSLTVATLLGRYIK